MSTNSLLAASYALLWFLVVAEGIGLFLVFRQFGVIYLSTRAGVEGDGIIPGRRAPNFTLPTPDGSEVSLAAIRAQGRGALLIFGAPHCRPCHQLLPEIQRVAASYGEEMATLFISQGTAEENRYFAGMFNGPATLLLTEDERLAQRYKTRVTPFAFAVDRQGVIRGKGLANSHKQLVEMIEQARSAPAPVEAEVVGSVSGTAPAIQKEV